MILPPYIQMCIDRLETAGFAAYAVGGCVRDALLGRTPQDYDLCSAATPEEMKAIFSDFPLVLAGEKHGTVCVITPEGPVEITTFRTEGAYHDHRHPQWVEFVSQVEGDLARRDFTVNAMAYSPTRGFADPFGGRADLQNGILRAVGDANARFEEDALRIMRGLRFSMRYHLKVEAKTKAAMLRHAHLLDKIAQERIFSELCKLIVLADTETLLEFAPIFGQILPELAPNIGFRQHSPHHAYDVFTHIAHVVAATPPILPVRLAALLHDVGKAPTFTTDETGRGHFYGHAPAGAQLADAALLRLKAPTALREQVVTLIAHHMTPLEPDKPLLRRRLGKFGSETVHLLLMLQRADFCSKGVVDSHKDITFFDRVEECLAQVEQEESCFTVRDLAINGKDLQQLGYTPGKALGQCLEELLALVQNEGIANTREALLKEAAKRQFQEEAL